MNIITVSRLLNLLLILMIISFSAIAEVTTSSTDSLRGNKPLSKQSTTPVMMRFQRDREPISRDYVQQPPLIPHKIKGYKINIKFNKCLTCHSWANYKQAGATKISQTHFSDRDNNVLANVAPRRYFCNQCHVPQVDVNPLVKNRFKPLVTIKKNTQ